MLIKGSSVMEKKKMRDDILTYLKSLSIKDQKEIEKKLHHRLFQEDIWKQAKTVGVTVSQAMEWDTNTIIEKAWAQGKNVAVPKCIPESKKMQFYEITSFDQLEIAYFNIQEPIPKLTKIVKKESIDLLIVPGLVFDRRGYRIGFGGGYYDRFLMNFINYTVSILSNRQLLDEVPKESHDLPVQYLITETETIVVNGDD